jgi:ATP-dependent RNA helicase RhlE
MSFDTLGLSPALLTALQATGIHTPTPIQAAAIGPALKGQDVLASAQTGSGKTLAFALPLLQHLLDHSNPGRSPQALVLVPTRELATQVGAVMQALTQHLPARVRVSVVLGGVSINPQMMALRGGTQVLVATPGRLLDLVSRNAVSLQHVQQLVLDEADRLLDLGFAEELQQVLQQLPTQRQHLFFSATLGGDVQALANTLLNEPVRVDVNPSEQHPTRIEQRAFLVDANRRLALLRQLLAEHDWGRVLVFVATKYAAEIAADKLRKVGMAAEPFHGELSQGKRSQVLADFKASRLRVVVATDLAARGLDVAGLPAVVNFDLPRSTQDYTHRIGRTGRFDASGTAISLVTPTTAAHWKLIAKRHGLDIALESAPGFVATEAEPVNDGTGGIKGRRPSKKDKLRAQAAAQGGTPSKR